MDTCYIINLVIFHVNDNLMLTHIITFIPCVTLRKKILPSILTHINLYEGQCHKLDDVYDIMTNLAEIELIFSIYINI